MANPITIMPTREIPIQKPVYPFSPDHRPTPHEQAYRRSRRVRHAFWFIREMSKRGPDTFERTISRRIAETYRLETSLIKRIKARFRCELSFGEGK